LIALGFVDALANCAWAIATTRGMLSLVAVIGALYPAVTVLLAILLLRERPQFLQGIGVFTGENLNLQERFRYQAE